MAEDELSELEQKILRDLRKSELSEKEVRVLLEQVQQQNPSVRTYDHHISGKKARIMIVSDTHIGHKEFKPELLDKVFAYARKFKPEAIYHPGDLTEGMSHRTGHVYELAQIGTTAQINYAAELFSQSPVPMYGITGNHDQWAWKATGTEVGEALEDKVDQFTYLGQNEADIQLSPSVRMKLFHPGDGTAYATSYKLQKLIESFTGGEKPQLLFEGHYHKALYMFSRNVHAFESGTLCGQTGWMRGKKIPAHMGFWLVDIYFKGKERAIQDVVPRFIPHYD